MNYVNAYFALLREAYGDIVRAMESNIAYGFFVGAIVLIPVFGTMFFFAVLVNAAPYTPPIPTANIAAQQLDDAHIAITLSNNTTPLNAVEVEFLFDPTHIYVSDIAITDSLCESRFVITKIIDNDQGRVFYQCGTITPFSGTSTTLSILKVTPLTVGTSSISLGTSTNALAHDGFGSNVTKTRIDSVFISQS